MKIKLVFLILLFVSTKLIVAQDSTFSAVTSISDVESRLAEYANSTISIESNFIQEKHLWMLDEVIVSEGIFLFKKTNSVRWQYYTPIKYTIVIHDGKFTIISNEKVNEFDIDSNPMFREINKMIVTAIKGDFIDNPDFEAEFFENESQYLAKLIPTNSQVSSMLTTIEIFFSKESMQVEKVIFNEPGDDFTSIYFNDRVINGDLPDTRFLISN